MGALVNAIKTWFYRESGDTKDKKSFIKKYKKAQNAASGSQVDANANVTQKNTATLQCELGKKDIIKLRRAIMHDYLKAKFGFKEAWHYRSDLKNHVIYQNDETSLFPYCASISLYPFVLNGLRDLGGSSKAPKHANGFVGGLINLIYQVASQFAGAVAVPETLTYLDHFLRVDYGEDYIDHLDEPVEIVGGHTFTLRHKIEDWFQQLVYSINQPAGARNYQSPFTNFAYFGENYFHSVFKDFVFPDGDEPKWATTKELQKMFMKWFNKERLEEVLTFPVETVNLLVKDGKYADEETADFMAEMWAEGHSFFMYQSDSVDALASCCFSKDQMVLARSTSRGMSKMYFDTFENIGKTSDGPDRTNFEVFHNGSWCAGKKISLPKRPMFKITTANNKEIIVSDNHLHPTLRGNIPTSELTEEDYLMFNVRPLLGVLEHDLHLTYEQGFAVGAFLGDGSFGSRVPLASGEKKIYEIDFSQNKEKYAKCVEMVNEAARQLDSENSCRLGQISNNVYPVRISCPELVEFIMRWTNWKEGTHACNKELNMDCLLQSLEFRQGILDGWYNTDGGNSNRCYTTSPKLASCMEALITSLGKNSIINISDRTDETVVIRGEENVRNYPLYCVRWYEPRTKRSMDKVYKIVNNSMYFRIKSIESVEYEGDIYCFEMNNADEPYFTLPNGLITHNCRLRNEVEDNVFSYTLGAGGVETGSKCVVTLNLNRIVQDWYRKSHRILFRYKRSLADYVAAITNRVHHYLEAWNDKLWDDYNAGLLTVYSAGFIDLDKQFLTVGVNGFVEAAEFLRDHGEKAKRYAGIDIDPNNQGYKNLAADILGTIKSLNKQHRTEHIRLNTEFIPAENAAAKLYNWDKRDGYVVPEGRNLYNSYFYVVEDKTVDPVKKFYYQGKGFATECDGGVALHNNLDEHLSKAQYRKLMDVAVDAGCNYFTYNIPNTVCRDCGHISKHHLSHCESCGSTNITYATRIIGYLKLIDNFSAPRQVEAGRRFYGKLGEEQ